jgi:hypothetical protein
MANRWVKTAPRRALQPVSQSETDQSDYEDSSDPEQLSFGQHVVAFFKELTAVVVGAIIVASLLRGFVGQLFLIPSVSMENTLQVDDRVLVEKLSSIQEAGSRALTPASAAQSARRSSLSAYYPTPAPSI